METMQQDIDISQIPPEYGGQSGRALDDSDDERKVTRCWLLLLATFVCITPHPRLVMRGINVFHLPGVIQ